MLTAKQEKFCQGIIAGFSQADAYKAAYNVRRMSAQVIYQEACLMMLHPKISVRISAMAVKIDEKVAKVIAIDKAWVISKLVKIADLGMAINPVLDASGEVMGELKTANLAAANTALTLIGKELSMFIDRKEVKLTTLQEMSDEDLDIYIAQKAREAGIVSNTVQ